MTESELKNHIREWIESAAPSLTAVIYADQEAPSPPRPYGTIRITNQIMLGLKDETRGLDVSDDLVHYGIRQASLSLNIYGDGAFDLMQDLQNSLSKNTVLDDFFYTDEISIINVSAIQNLTDLMDTNFEQRAQMDLILTYAQDYTDETGYFDTVEITDEILTDTFIVDLS